MFSESEEWTSGRAVVETVVHIIAADRKKKTNPKKLQCED